MICRICKKYKESGERMFKYSTRHYAHYLCYMRSRGADGFKNLSGFQLRQFPYIPAKELGILPALEKAIANATY